MGEALTAAEMDALPEEAVVLASEGPLRTAWQKLGNGRWGAYDAGEVTSAELVAEYSPVHLMVIEGDA